MKDGSFKDIVHPLDKATREVIEQQVIKEYERVLAERRLRSLVPQDETGLLK